MFVKHLCELVDCSLAALDFSASSVKLHPVFWCARGHFSPALGVYVGSADYACEDHWLRSWLV